MSSTWDPRKADPADTAGWVHPFVRVGAAWSWRLIVMFGAVLCVGYLVKMFAAVIVPLSVALLAAALLIPAVNWMQRRGVPRGLAVALVLVASIGVVAGILTFVVEQFISGLPEISAQFTTSVHQAQRWLTNGPLHLSDHQISKAGENLTSAVQDNQERLTNGALATATVIAEFLTGAFLTFFILIFFLYGGHQVWEFVTRIVPRHARERVRVAGTLGFGSLIGFVRATVAVAAVDAVGIGTGLAILGVPLALPLASLVFIGAFIPIVGGFLAGCVAVFIALMTKGLVTALITLGIIIAVMQIEGHVLQPLFLGRAVSVHPLGVVLAIAAGVVLAGIPGGLLAVPLVAVLNTAIRSLLATDPASVLDGPETGPRFKAEPDQETNTQRPLVSLVKHRAQQDG